MCPKPGANPSAWPTQPFQELGPGFLSLWDSPGVVGFVRRGRKYWPFYFLTPSCAFCVFDVLLPSYHPCAWAKYNYLLGLCRKMKPKLLTFPSSVWHEMKACSIFNVFWTKAKYRFWPLKCIEFLGWDPRVMGRFHSHWEKHLWLVTLLKPKSPRAVGFFPSSGALGGVLYALQRFIDI